MTARDTDATSAASRSFKASAKTSAGEPFPGLARIRALPASLPVERRCGRENETPSTSQIDVTHARDLASEQEHEGHRSLPASSERLPVTRRVILAQRLSEH